MRSKTKESHPLDLQFFEDIESAVSYAWGELLSTLEDDLNKMQCSERRSYTNSDRLTMEKRIADLTALEPLATDFVTVSVMVGLARKVKP